MIHYNIDLVYRVNALLRWSASSFRDALFCTYEQVRQPVIGCSNAFKCLHTRDYDVVV